MEWILIASIGILIANLAVLWIVVKLYTEVFKQQKIDANFREAREQGRKDAKGF